MSPKFVALCAIAAASGLAGNCWATSAPGSISGTYVSQGPDFVEFLQITEGSERNLSGTLTDTKLDAKGRIQRNSEPITGITDGQAITITATEKSPSQPSGATDSVEDEVITLSAPNWTGHFIKSDMASYQDALDRISAQSKALLTQNK